MSISELKQKAINLLSNTYWMSFGATMIFMILYYLCGMFAYAPVYILEMISDGLDTDAYAVLLVLMLIFILIGGLTVCFVGLPLWVGHNAFYLKSADSNTNLSHLFDGFKYKYWNNIKTMFLYFLYLTLWTYLAFIPFIVFALGSSDTLINMTNSTAYCLATFVSLAACIISSVKRYQYFMVEYIIADNPEISSGRAFKISKAATKGYKMKIFLLELSFTGWFLLGSILCGLGIPFIMPYFFASKIQCYLFLKENAIKNGIASHADFNTDTLKGYVL